MSCVSTSEEVSRLCSRVLKISRLSLEDSLCHVLTGHFNTKPRTQIQLTPISSRDQIAKDQVSCRFYPKEDVARITEKKQGRGAAFALQVGRDCLSSCAF